MMSSRNAALASARPLASFATTATDDVERPSCVMLSGDAVTVTGYPMKSGDPAIWVNKLTGPGGQDLPLFNH